MRYARLGGIYDGRFTVKQSGASPSRTKELSSGFERKGIAQVHSDWMGLASNARSTNTFMILVPEWSPWQIIPVLKVSDIGCDPNETSYKLNRLVSP